MDLTRQGTRLVGTAAHLTGGRLRQSGLCRSLSIVAGYDWLGAQRGTSSLVAGVSRNAGAHRALELACNRDSPAHTHESRPVTRSSCRVRTVDIGLLAR